MSNIAIEFDNVGKMYRLGRVGTGTLSHDLDRWWTMNVLRKEDPFLKIGETNDRSTKGHSDYVWALRDISFKVEQGDVVGIIGKNGAGKSTLLKLLSRITSPSTGNIRYKGRIASLLEVGTGFHPEMTGRENIYMNGSIMGMTKKEITRKLDEIVDFAGVERYLDTPVKRYSSGMTVRLGFAVAAFLEPEILVVDEVLTVGDAEFQKKAIGKMKDVSQGEGRTVLFVSHNMAAVRHLCKKGIVLQNGQLYFQGKTNNAIDEYMKLGVDCFTDTPLSEMPRGTKTNGLIRFLDIEYLDENNVPINPHCGRFLRLRLTMDVKSNDVRSCGVSVDIKNMYGDPLMSFPSCMVMDDFPLTQGKHCVILDIPKLPLTVGTYRISLWSEINRTIYPISCADYIDSMIKMDVKDDDFFNKGKQFASHLSGKIVLCEYKWTIS